MTDSFTSNTKSEELTECPYCNVYFVDTEGILVCSSCKPRFFRDLSIEDADRTLRELLDLDKELLKERLTHIRDLGGIYGLLLKKAEGKQ